MSVAFSKETKGIVAIAGHVGCGHCHSLNNQVQDDSAGLSVVVSLFKEATGLNLKLKDIFVDYNNTIVAIMENGGVGTARVRRAVTPQEKKLIRNLVGKEIINTHTLVLEVFGRFFGQGVTETPVATQAAIANAVLDGFVKNYSDKFLATKEDVANNIGNIIGTVLDIDGVPTSVLATVNASDGGIGPLEDLEGNSTYYVNKKKIIEDLGMDKLPTLVVEAMIYSSFSQGLVENTFFVRADDEDDNPYVRKAIVEAGDNLGIPVRFFEGGGMKRTKDALRNNTKKVAENIKALADKLYNAETSEDKVNIIADLAVAVSQDCGGISFMTNDIHEEIGGAGMLRKTSAVINLVTTKQYAKENPIPYVDDEECREYVALSKETIKVLAKNAKEATEFILK